MQALKDLGYHPEVGHNLPLYGYQGDLRPQTADIVIRRKEVGSASNDAGFIWNSATKNYTQIISEFDAGQGRLTTKMIKKAYAPHKVMKAARKHGFRIVKKQQKEGQLHLVLRR